MRKLLLATTALALAGGGAAAELTMSGSAELGFEYNQEPGEGMAKHKFHHDMGISFAGSGTTDGGLSFGGSAGFDSKTGGGSNDDGSVYVSGSFGKISIGDVDRGSDLAGGIADVGLNGIGVDDVVEDMRETSAKSFRYENSFDQITIALSAGVKDGTAASAASVWTINSSLSNAINRYHMAPTPGIYATNFGLVFTANTNAAGTTSNASLTSSAHTSNLLGSSYSRTVTKGSDGKDVVTWHEVDLVTSGADKGKISARNLIDPTAGSAEVQAATKAHIAAVEAYLAGYGAPPEQTAALASEPATSHKFFTITEESVLENRPHQSDDAVVGVASDAQYAFGMSFDAGGVRIGIGYDSEKTVSMGMGFTAGEISTSALYVKNDDGATGVGMDVSYSIDASTLTLAYARSTPETGDATDAMGVNVSHDLGGGASLVAGFGQVGDVNKAEAGISFSF